MQRQVRTRPECPPWDREVERITKLERRARLHFYTLPLSFLTESPRTVLGQRALRGKQKASHAKACCIPPMLRTPFGTRFDCAATPSSPRPRRVPGRGARDRLQGPPPLQECAAFVWDRAWPVHRAAERLLPPGPRSGHPSPPLPSPAS